MGSSCSKIDNSEAVTLCRGRSKYLSEAIVFRCAFSDAHVEYFRALKSVSESLNQFMDGIDTICNAGSVTPQFLYAQKDERDSVEKDEEISRVQQHHHGRNQPSNYYGYYGESSGHPVTVPEVRNVALPPELIYSNEPSDGYCGSYPHHVTMPVERCAAPPPYAPGISNCEFYEMNYVNYSVPMREWNKLREEEGIPDLEDVEDSAYASSSMDGEINEESDEEVDDNGHTNDHFKEGIDVREKMDNAINLGTVDNNVNNAPGISNCEFYEMNYVNYSVPMREWNKLREEEGIPDLEDVEDSAYASSSMDGEINEESDEEVDDDGHTNDYFKEGIDVREKMDNDINLGTVDNNATSDVKEMTEEKSEAMMRIKCYNTLSKVTAAAKSQFDKASESAAELFEIIEVGKRQYHQKISVHKSGFDVQAFFKRVINGARSRLLSKNHQLIAKEEEDAHFSLSSTLQKLIIWEMKLYYEVMEEEKMRFAYEKKCKEMMRLIEKGAEQQKLGTVVLVLKKLSVKIRLSIQVIDFISTNIAVLRDEILFPQVCQLIKGLARMWSSMYECYKTLREAIPEENFLQSFSCGDKSCSDAQLETTKQLGLELIEWTIKFSTWINAQKDFITALNGWLLIAIRYNKEETSDGVAPFSPSNLGAPSIFVICNQWDQTMHRVSEKEIILSMQSFASAVLSLWRKQKAEQQQKLLVNKEMEKELKAMEKEEKEMCRIVKARSKKLMHVSGQNGIVMSEENADESRLHVGLRQMIESMENYCAANLKVYDELDIRIEEENGRAD